MKKKTLTYEKLRAALSYSPETGSFTRIMASGPSKMGDIAGHKSESLGYIFISVDGAPYLAHRLAVFYMTGEWPKNQIGHLDMDRANNRWANLREATKSQNMRNRGPQQNNSTGHKCISFDKANEKYEVRVKLYMKGFFGGRFQLLSDAISARDELIERLHGEFARVA